MTQKCRRESRDDTSEVTQIHSSTTTTEAAEFSNVDVEYLLSWYKYMRTRYGKLSKLPTGSGAQELTE